MGEGQNAKPDEAVFGAALVEFLNRKIDEKFSELSEKSSKELDKKFSASSDELNRKFNVLNINLNKLNEKFNALSGNFDNLSLDLNKKFKKLEDRLAAHESYPNNPTNSGIHVPQTRQRLVLDSVSHPEWRPAGPND